MTGKEAQSRPLAIEASMSGFGRYYWFSLADGAAIGAGVCFAAALDPTKGVER